MIAAGRPFFVRARHEVRRHRDFRRLFVGQFVSFNDMLRRAKVDPVIAKALTGHVTEQMREHYSTVGLDEKRAAVASVPFQGPEP